MHQTKIGQFFKRVGSEEQAPVNDPPELASIFKRKASTSPADKSTKVRKTTVASTADESPVKGATAKGSQSPTASAATATLGSSFSAATLPTGTGWDNEYNPGKSNYHPIDDASWERGQR